MLIYFKDSDLKAKFLFKNKAIKRSKNTVRLGGNNVVRGCMGDNFTLLLAMSQFQLVWLVVFLLGSVEIAMLHWVVMFRLMRVWVVVLQFE